MNAARAIALTTAALAAASAAVPATAAESAVTAVSGFSWTDADGDTDYFDGHIASSENKCIKDRRVSVFRKQQGRDARIGRTATDRKGKWLLEREDPGSGRYYVRVKRTEVGSLTCSRAEAGPLRVEDLDGV